MDHFASTVLIPRMALASSTSRSTTAPTPTQSTTNHLDGGGGGGTPTLSPATSLPFTFLIAFITIFLFFIACGCSTRRYILRLRRRRNAPHREAAAVGPKTARSDVEKPVLWDVRARVEAEEDAGWERVEKDGARCWKQWAGMQPLSVTYVRAPEDPSYYADMSHPLPSHARRIRLPSVLLRTYDRIPFLPPFSPRLPPCPSPHTVPELPEALPPVIALQMSFTIAMPSGRRHHRTQTHPNTHARDSMACGESMATSLVSWMSEDSVLDEKRRQRDVGEDELGEYVLGMTEVPWRVDS